MVLRRAALLLAWLTTVLAMVVLGVGWGLDVAVARSVLPGNSYMAPFAALALTFAGASLLLQLGHPRWHGPGMVLAAAAVLMGLVFLAEDLTGRSLGIDDLLFRDTVARTNQPHGGRPAPQFSLAVLLVGSALVLLRARARYLQPLAAALALLAALASAYALIGYALSVEPLYQISVFRPIPAHAALALLLLATAVLCALPEHGPVRLLSRRAPSGYVSRRLLPVAVGAPVILGFLAVWGERVGAFGSEVAITLLVVLGIVVTGGAIWLSALALEREEEKRRLINRERERLLVELRAERARLREIFELSPVAVSLVQGPDFVFELANPEYLRISGRTELEGKPFLEAFPETQPDAPIMHVLRGVYETGEAYTAPSFRVLIERRQGGGPEECFFHFTTQALRDRAGQITSLLTVAVDVSARVRVEQELERLLVAEREARAAAELANQAKSQFLSHMSHELRTPLNAILGYAELLQTGVAQPLSEKAQGFVERIRAAATHQKQLVEDVLAFSRLQAGRDELLPADVATADLLGEIDALVRPLAERQGLELAMDVSAAPATLRTDPRKLRQILLNLLGNAVKFTPSGRIAVTVRAGDGSTSFEVEDTGIGIAPEYYERLFEPFWQVDSSLTRTAEGTGLGLTIARRLAQLLGGEIAVHSTPGQGSRFVLSLPEEPPVAAPALSPTARPAAAR